MIDTRSSREDTRSRIVSVAATLLQEHGAAALTTRGVARGAEVQAPTIYRLFGDKDGLLEAVAEHVMATHVSAKAAVVESASADGVDPIVELRAGWQTQIDFSLANPDLFRLLSDPARGARSAAVESGKRLLGARVQRVAATGRLRVSEQRAVGLIQAAGVGAVQTILATPPEQRDHGLADAIFDAVLAQILLDAPDGTDGTDGTDGGTIAAVVAFRAVAPRLEMLSPSERLLMAEWLDRAIDGL